jgi:ketosteroid isomerase-like protein
MHRIPLVIVFVARLIAPALAQQADNEAPSPTLAQQIEAANAKFVDFFNKGDFDGIASLYTENAAAFPPGSSMVQGRAAIEAMWKGMGEEVTDPELSTLEVKPLGPTAAQEFGQFGLKTKGSAPHEVTGKYVVIWEKVGDDWKIATDIWNQGN